MVLVHVSGEHPAEGCVARDEIFVVECFFGIGNGERAIVDGTDLERFVSFAGGFAVHLHFESNVHRHLLCRLAEPIEFVVHLRRDEVFLVRLGQLSDPRCRGHEIVFLHGDFDLRVGRRRFDGNADQTEAFAEQIRIGLFRFFVFGLDRTHGGGGHNQRREQLMIHVRFRFPLDVGAAKVRRAEEKRGSRDQVDFHRARIVGRFCETPTAN
jgi:hypothetical protein